MIILIDGDLEVAYKAGFRSEPVMYYVNGKDFQYKKDAVMYCKKEEIDPFEINKEKDYFSLKYNLKQAEECIEEIVESVLQEYKLGQCDTEIYLTGDDNFRYYIDDTYKANRSTSEKPKHLVSIKDYLIAEYNAILREPLEADDLIGIRASELRKEKKDYIIVSQDKDLDQIQGLHYNTRHNKFYEVTEDEGVRYIWQQMLTGDRADNIYGIYGIGDKRALELMDEIPTDGLAEMVKVVYNEREMLEKFSSNLELLTILQEEK